MSMRLAFLLALLCSPAGPSAAAQQVDPSCPQQVYQGESFDSETPPTFAIAVSPEHYARRVEARDGLLRLLTPEGGLLDELSYRSIEEVAFRPLAGRDSALIVLRTSGGGGTVSWSGVDLIRLTACHLLPVWDGPTFVISAGPDSLVQIDSAQVSVAGDTVLAVGRTFGGVWRGEDPPEELPASSCSYSRSWVWDRGAEVFVLRRHQASRPKCAI